MEREPLFNFETKEETEPSFLESLKNPEQKSKEKKREKAVRFMRRIFGISNEVSPEFKMEDHESKKPSTREGVVRKLSRLILGRGEFIRQQPDIDQHQDKLESQETETVQAEVTESRSENNRFLNRILRIASFKKRGETDSAIKAEENIYRQNRRKKVAERLSQYNEKRQEKKLLKPSKKEVSKSLLEYEYNRTLEEKEKIHEMTDSFSGTEEQPKKHEQVETLEPESHDIAEDEPVRRAKAAKAVLVAAPLAMRELKERTATESSVDGKKELSQEANSVKLARKQTQYKLSKAELESAEETKRYDKAGKEKQTLVETLAGRREPEVVSRHEILNEAKERGQDKHGSKQESVATAGRQEEARSQFNKSLQPEPPSIYANKPAYNEVKAAKRGISKNRAIALLTVIVLGLVLVIIAFFLLRVSL